MLVLSLSMSMRYHCCLFVGYYCYYYYYYYYYYFFFLFFYFLSKCSRNALELLLQLRVCVHVTTSKKRRRSIAYIFFFFSLSLRFVTTGLVYLSAILFVASVVRPFLDRFSIPTPSTSSLCGETTRTTSWRIVIYRYSLGLKFQQ